MGCRQERCSMHRESPPENNSNRPLFLTSNFCQPCAICSLIFKKWHGFCHVRIGRFGFSYTRHTHASAPAESSGSVGEPPNSHFPSRLVPVAKFIKGAQGKGGEAAEEWGNWDGKQMGKFLPNRPMFHQFSSCFLSKSHIFYTFPKGFFWQFLTIPHFPSISPHVPGFPHFSMTLRLVG